MSDNGIETMLDDLQEIGTDFDAEKQKKTRQQTNELKKRNIKNTFGSGAGRVAIFMFAGVVLVLAGVGFYNFNRKPPMNQQRPDASGAMAPSPNGYGSTIAATEQEANMRREADNMQSSNVSKQGGVYIPGPVITSSTGNDFRTGGNAMAPASAAAAGPASVPGGAAPASAPAAAATAPAAAPAMVVDQQTMQKITTEVTAQMVCAMGKPCPTASVSTFTTGQYHLPERTVAAMPVSAQATAGSTNGQAGVTNAQLSSQQLAAASGQKPLIDAGDAYYCRLKNGVNSDATRRDVVLNCFATANETFTMIGRAEASNADAMDPSFSVTLDKFSRAGKGMIAVNAIGVDEGGESAMVDDVDKHSVRKYGSVFVAGLLKGLGQAASIITGTTSATTVGNVTTTTTTTDRIDARRTAQMAAGQAGMAWGDTFSREAQAIKTTMKLYPGKDVTVIFLAPVYEEKKY
ncbi:TrbI/VirB10 family protein [Cupriavidus sp. TMH.W2]|uniref:TrbI/VirB10 family protein n=1 Tax=Cupriavidus sp. TMH.W2 TaxID=3434465 RepID=UPI003D770B6E